MLESLASVERREESIIFAQAQTGKEKRRGEEKGGVFSDHTNTT